jgi:tetratricopeptide (TPR) repeat protein
VTVTTFLRSSIAPLVIASTLAIAACDPGPPAAPSLGALVDAVQLPEADPGQPWSAANVALREVPEPELHAVEQSVRDQISERRARLAALLAAPTTARAALGEAMGGLGMLYHNYDMKDAAEACYLNAMQLVPRDFRWPYFAARLESSRGRYDPAVAHYERTLAARPDYVPALYWLADARRNLGDPERARGLLEHAARLDPGSAATLVALGQLALAASDPATAVSRFESALALEPDTPSIHYGLAMAYRGLGRTEESRDHLERSAPGTLVPDDPAMLELLSQARGRGAAHSRAAQAMDSGRFAYAAEEFQRLADEDPDDAWTRVNLGLARQGLGDEDAAVAEFEAAIAADPGQIQAHLELGRIWFRHEDYGRAVEHLEAVLETDPSDLDATYLLAASLLETGRIAEAQTLLRKVVEGNPGNARAHVQLAMALCWTGRHVEALEVLERAHAALPEADQVSEALARLLAATPDPRSRDGRRALELVEGVVGDEAMDLAQVQTVAMAHAALGESRSAVEWQQRAIDAARRLNRVELLKGLEDNLARYREGRACEVPWLAPPPP